MPAGLGGFLLFWNLNLGGGTPQVQAVPVPPLFSVFDDEPLFVDFDDETLAVDFDQ